LPGGVAIAFLRPPFQLRNSRTIRGDRKKVYSVKQKKNTVNNLFSNFLTQKIIWKQKYPLP